MPAIRRLVCVLGVAVMSAATGSASASSHPVARNAARSGVIKVTLENFPYKHGTICPYAVGSHLDAHPPTVGGCGRIHHMKATLKHVRAGKVELEKKGDPAVCDQKPVRVKAHKTVKVTWSYTLPCTVGGST